MQYLKIFILLALAASFFSCLSQAEEIDIYTDQPVTTVGNSQYPTTITLTETDRIAFHVTLTTGADIEPSFTSVNLVVSSSAHSIPPAEAPTALRGDPVWSKNIKIPQEAETTIYVTGSVVEARGKQLYAWIDAGDLTYPVTVSLKVATVELAGGSDPSLFATADQGTLADTALQLPDTVGWDTNGGDDVLSINGVLPDGNGDIAIPDTIIVTLGGQFLLDPGEVNGWQLIGPVDNTNNADLGDVGAVNLTWASGGYVFPFDVKIKSFSAWHRNSNAAALPWGWVISRNAPTPSTTTQSTTFMLDESYDRATSQFNLRDYGNNTLQYTLVKDFVNDVIPAGEIINVGVGAPTAVGTNYWVQVAAGSIEFERL